MLAEVGRGYLRWSPWLCRWSGAPGPLVHEESAHVDVNLAGASTSAMVPHQLS